ncbi:MAG TPA: YtxH domain-containing protein [Cyclobacteriaceae bacterium]|jgi:gas vesicle protein|nr:YtxH domain-containing protein [Cyclobacteriaceae bacterium]
MNTKHWIGGLLAGTALGVAIGVLIAPAEGKETIAKLKKGAKKLTGPAKDSVEDSIDSILDKYYNGIDAAAKKVKV